MIKDIFLRLPGIVLRLGYILYKEGPRAVLSKIRSKTGSVKQGKRKYENDKETIILVSHESSATGAPLLGLNIARSLNEKFNVINMVLRKSNIHEMFFEDAFLVIDGMGIHIPFVLKYLLKTCVKKYNVKCVICNSVVTFPALKAANEINIPTLSLVHEFAEYTKPDTIMRDTLYHANKVVLPATIIKTSILEQLDRVFTITKPPSNIALVPQGKLKFLPESYGEDNTPKALCEKLNIDKDTKVIVGSGYVDIRKGVDLFLYTARYIKNHYKGKLKFVWVGDGYKPEIDFTYCLWLEREIKYLGLESDFAFLSHQKSLDAIFSVSDIFCLTSRMDPFPNVVIDAMEADLPIACFKDTTGSVEFLNKNKAESIIADYLDVHGLGKMISAYLKGDTKKGVNQKIAKEKLDFDIYMARLFALIDAVNLDQKESLEILETLKKSDSIDTKFFSHVKNRDKSLLNHINIYKKNLLQQTHNFNPRPGFSNLKWMKDNDKENIVPLFEALKNDALSTHPCKLIPFEHKAKVSYRYAVHLHLFYEDIGKEFCRYFKNLPGKFDLFITVVDETIKDRVYHRFKACNARNIEVIVVENIGRDMGPLIFDLKKKILKGNYEVIGHFHSKKSLDTNTDMGNRWRRFLLDNLIGTKDDAKSVLSLFNDPRTGLVFPEDMHYVDMGKNKDYMDELCKMTGMTPIEETPVFPVGNMFWARTDSIKQLFELDKETILEKEPLPYDGSFMHALERITPSLVQKNKFTYTTVYKKGTRW
ncbi:MAG: glycosyltransferase [Proteobacteria bacterium]|nr:glycosyltransferase [Desulfobacula sp.]MBU4131227.1 glycosyltransferase [Pseudomonadota bacterium]